ncbi:MAG: class A beta-lactamase [Candidatus Eremiobacteraeota bacterium]|nr:class A beta-lactamase [Candidatus Eremiobacteraeota bacterium]
MLLTRSLFLYGAASAALLPALSSTFATLESKSGGRLGVYAMDGDGRTLAAYRSHERFPMCSTFKVLAAGAVLSRVDGGNERLDRAIHYTKADLLEYAPIASKHVARGEMSVGALCAAAVEYSDNTAANLLLASIGGPAAVTRFARSLGDSVTRLDRNEPSLNTAIPGDPRDTTTPAAMANDVRAMTAGNALSRASSALLVGWLQACVTGTDALRAGFPAGWAAGDKTGTGMNGTHNDVAIAWPPAKAGPIFVSAYLTGASESRDAMSATLAAVGKAVSSTR